MKRKQNLHKQRSSSHNSHSRKGARKHDRNREKRISKYGIARAILEEEKETLEEKW